MGVAITVATAGAGTLAAAVASVAWAGAFGAVYGYVVGAIKDYKEFGKNNIGTNTANITTSNIKEVIKILSQGALKNFLVLSLKLLHEVFYGKL